MSHFGALDLSLVKTVELDSWGIKLMYSIKGLNYNSGF